MRKKNLLLTLLYYFIICAFLFPRGYAEFNTLYKNISTFLIWSSTALIWLYFIFYHSKSIKYKEMNFLKFFGYFIFIAFITFFQRGININGLQKIISYPTITLFIICAMKHNARNILNCINNVILCFLLLNLFILKDFFTGQFHITFLGHVQMISQLGLISIFCSSLYYILYHEKKTKTVILILLSLYTMGTADASTAVYSMIILITFLLLYKLKIYNILKFNSKFYINFAFIIDVIIIFLSLRNNLIYHNSIRFLDLNGRSFIWIAAINKIKNSFLIGYGIEGCVLNVFWNNWINASGLNYTHNQILQNLLDGGLIGLILYQEMLYISFKNVKNIKDIKLKLLINSILIVFLSIMIFESTSLYCYMYIFLAIVYSLPMALQKKESEMNGNIQ